MKRTVIWLIAVCSTGLFSVAETQAIPCGDGSGVGGSVDCRDGYSAVDSENYLNGIGTLQSDFGDPQATAPFFGFDQWTYITKMEEDGGSINIVGEDIGLEVYATGSTSFGSGIGAKDGTWSFNDDLWNRFDHLAIILKGGNDDIGWSAYLLADDVSSGTWDFSNTYRTSLSHLSVYGVPGTEIPEPEPASLLLFGAGLGGLVWYRARRNGKRGSSGQKQNADDLS